MCYLHMEITRYTDRKKRRTPMKRADYISWDQYFMGIALLSAERSKDPSTQVGACIVDEIIVFCRKGIMVCLPDAKMTSCHGERSVIH